MFELIWLCERVVYICVLNLCLTSAPKHDQAEEWDTHTHIQPDNCCRFFQWTHANWIQAIEIVFSQCTINGNCSHLSVGENEILWTLRFKVICVQLIEILLLSLAISHFIIDTIIKYIGIINLFFFRNTTKTNGSNFRKTKQNSIQRASQIEHFPYQSKTYEILSFN